MSDLIQCLKDAYISNPAEALDLIPEVIQQYDEGKIVELPCKAGDTVYKPCDGKIHNGKILEIGVSFSGQVCVRYEMPTYYSCDRTGTIGETVFLSRESAEKALKKRSKSHE